VSSPGRLCLTFDDGPDETWTPRILEALRRLEATATFFLIAERVPELPWIVRLIAEGGHEVALHCNEHIRHTDLGEEEIEADTRIALATLADVGLHPARWRTPWGICTPATIAVSERHELELVHWSIDTHDWRGDSTSAMIESVEAGIEDGAIVLMHDGIGPGARRAGCENTLELLGPLCGLARSRGLLPAALPPLFPPSEAPPARGVGRTEIRVSRGRA
jgi:peptidoglycan/xylan/chitin deacetylase (PgdA/CDA1 family)